MGADLSRGAYVVMRIEGEVWGEKSMWTLTVTGIKSGNLSIIYFRCNLIITSS